MPRIVYGYKAIVPITAWHVEEGFPDGHEVTYEPGDEVPAGEWKGAAVNAMIENEKLMRYARNVYEPGEFGGDAPPVDGDRDELLRRIEELEAAQREAEGNEGGFADVAEGSRRRLL